MRFRILTFEELQLLEKEFVQYLVANGIPAEDWVKMKQEEPEMAITHIEKFSDIVLEKVLGKIQFIEERQPHELRIYHCSKEKMILLGLTVDPELNLDLTKPQSISTMITVGYELPKNGIKVFRTEKAYEPAREDEIFKMIHAGAHVTDDKMFKILNQVVLETKGKLLN